MKGWLLHHKQASSQALRRLAGTPLNTLLGALVLGIALALPAAGEMLLPNFPRLAQRVAARREGSVCLPPDAADRGWPRPPHWALSPYPPRWKTAHA